MSEKIYCGNAKVHTFNDGGSVLNVMIDVDELAKNFKQYGFTTWQGKRKMRINIYEAREPDRYGNTHCVTVDTWVPTKRKEPEQSADRRPGDVSKYPNMAGFKDDIPQGAVSPGLISDDKIPF